MANHDFSGTAKKRKRRDFARWDKKMLERSPKKVALLIEFAHNLSILLSNRIYVRRILCKHISFFVFHRLLFFRICIEITAAQGTSVQIQNCELHTAVLCSVMDLILKMIQNRWMMSSNLSIMLPFELMTSLQRKKATIECLASSWTSTQQAASKM